jgi:hypothetical protein
MASRTSRRLATAQEPPVNAAPKDLPITPPSRVASDSDDVRARIAQAAYYRALERGFAPGQEVEDWLEAEASILNRNDR